MQSVAPPITSEALLVDWMTVKWYLNVMYDHVLSSGIVAIIIHFYTKQQKSFEKKAFSIFKGKERKKERKQGKERKKRKKHTKEERKKEKGSE